MKEKSKDFGKTNWEMSYHPTVKKDTKKVWGAEFDPRKAKERMSTYKKINSQDD